MKELFDEVVRAWHEFQEAQDELNRKRFEDWGNPETNYTATLALAKHCRTLVRVVGGRLSNELGLAVGQTVAVPGKEWVIVLSPFKEGDEVQAKVQVFPALWVKGGK